MKRLFPRTRLRRGLPAWANLAVTTAGTWSRPERPRPREIHRRFGRDLKVRDPLMDEEPLKPRAIMAAQALPSTT